ncbi:serine protease easter-like isoform X2 [Contarinia nasturtii]|uniref:serine protease easter-like isoform X2 n=1 Tax=Contarinia nasturtii TaxID=265458 RepID=UPI0012D4B910|nr:serine protease easter-like isoform X2 [Contarinia nasturtii]
MQKNYITKLFVLMCFICIANTQQCTTPNNTRGSCINIFRCKVLYDIYQNPFSTNYQQTYLSLSYNNCGAQMVCCPMEQPISSTEHYFDYTTTRRPVIAQPKANVSPCSTLEYRRGYCTYLNYCPIPYSLFSNQYTYHNFLRNINTCGSDFYGNQWVCCADASTEPPTEPPTQPPTHSDLLPQPGVDCGIQLYNRMVHRESAEIAEYPWHAMIGYRNQYGDTHFHCGGVLINKNYVLTAARCMNSRSLLVRLGEWDTTTDPDEEDGQKADPVKDIQVEKRIIHGRYNGQTKQNDIGLLRLAESVSYSNWIRPICLPTLKELIDKDYNGEFLKISGFGQTENENMSTRMMKAELDFMPFNQCYNKYQSEGITLTNKQMCAGVNTKTRSCKGDYGGPLMAQHTNRRLSYYYLVGIISFTAKSCSQPEWPGVYTRVDQYIDWIISNIRH